MTTRSITHRILRTALALAVLVQSAFAASAGACGVSGSCCTASSSCQESDDCCCSRTDESGHSCCSSTADASANESSSCCRAGDDSTTRCTCHCGQPKPAPVAPPADTDTQVRLVPVYGYVTVAANPAPVLSAPTGRFVCQSSLLQIAPCSAQVMFCTWLT